MYLLVSLLDLIRLVIEQLHENLAFELFLRIVFCLSSHLSLENLCLCDCLELLDCSCHPLCFKQLCCIDLSVR